jgi:hypothetical protein
MNQLDSSEGATARGMNTGALPVAGVVGLRPEACVQIGAPVGSDEVVVVIGVGGMGELIARRQGSGRRLLVTDVSEVARSRRWATRWTGLAATSRRTAST